MDYHGVLGDFPRNAWHVPGFPHEDVSVSVEEADERTFLFRGNHGTNTHRFTLGAVGIYEDLFGALRRFERPG